MRNLLRQLVETESPSHDKAAVDRVGAIVADECRKLGADVEIIPNRQTGDLVLARFQPSTQNPQCPILILCHMDTVFPIGALQKFPYREADGKIHGPGVLDMKAGIVIALTALANRAADTRPVWTLFTSDEEIGSHTSRVHIERLARQCEVVFVLEGALADGSLKTWRKGVGEFLVKVKGRAAHAGGDHQAGRNAIEEMAHQVLAIQKLTAYEKQTTLNVGVIRGGTASNVIPDEAVIEVDVRVMQPGEWERVEAEIRNLKPVLEGTSLEITGALNRPPMPYGEGNRFAFEKAAQIAKDKLGFELKAGGSGGGSDGNFVAPLGIPVLDGLGAVGEGYHSEREYIFADSLEERAKLLEVLIRNW
ncbi:MAG: M20 family metallopeptidase [Chloroflexi bacterium]|nr:M20 family metallopeptidase [Chloroflexota bacterium]MCA2002026.1 M20 family metallopeptidase [Chloroflexota bacterium]